MSNLKRVLIAGLTSETGGMESYVMNLYRHINREHVQFDFVNHLSSTSIAFSDEILELGGKIYNVPMVRHDLFEHYRALDELFNNNDYQALYYQANRRVKNVDLFRYAKKHKIPHRILHSHNSMELGENIINRTRAEIAEKNLKKYVTDCWACSVDAGKWMFSDKDNVVVVNNGVDTNVFDFDSSIAESVRNQEQTGKKLVFGTVGRMCRQKNSLFLIDIFADIHKQRPETVFWHIGGGEMESAMRQRVEKLGLVDSYRFLGRKNNVSDYLKAMDVLLLPSEYEGFPITLVEAQCSGLKCLVSNTITESVDITGNVSFKSIQDSSLTWADAALQLSDYNRQSCKDILKNKGYDEQSIADWFESFIMSDVQ